MCLCISVKVELYILLGALIDRIDFKRTLSNRSVESNRTSLMVSCLTAT